MGNKERVGELARIRADNRRCNLRLSGRDDSQRAHALVARDHPFPKTIR